MIALKVGRPLGRVHSPQGAQLLQYTMAFGGQIRNS